MSRVVVVGGGGFVGRHLLRRLVETGDTVHATCRPQSAAEPITGIEWIETDLTLPDATRRWPRHCDTVVYLAQSRQWRPFPEGASDVFHVNVQGSFLAAEYARSAGTTRFIYASTGSVYPTVERASHESDPFAVPGDRTFYSAAKLSSELLLGPYASRFAVIVLRLFVPYGEGQAADMLIPRLVNRVRDGLPITLYGDDGLRLNPVAISDVTETLVRCATLDRSATMNVAGPEVLTLREVGEAIGRVVGRSPVFEQSAAAGSAAIVGDTSSLRAALGWAPGVTLAEGLRDWLG